RPAKPLTRKTVQKACIGNLCRCTGYESILRAGSSVDPKSMRSLNDLYPPSQLVPSIRLRFRDSVEISADNKRFFIPSTIEEATRWRADHPACMIISGGTDVGVQMNKC